MESSKKAAWREKLYEIIFEADTPAGRAFDILLLWSICISVVAVMLESVAAVGADYGSELLMVEWFFTGVFTLEYILRLLAVRRPMRYATSFFGVVDLLTILPTYLSFFIPGAHALLTIRTFRLLRVFRILKLGHYLSEADFLKSALHASRRKIAVFLTAVSATVVSVGTLMYLVEGSASGFTSIPISIYWAIVTMTTVGYGDITPNTPLGQTIASVLMITGYGIIAVPTGIVTSELVRAGKNQSVSTQACPQCLAYGHDTDARHCKHCGSAL